MKSRTKIEGGEIFYAYEDYDGNQFGTWKELARNGRGPCYLVGYFYSYWFNRSERIDEMFLPGRPTIGIVRRFIESCKAVMN